MLKRALRFLNEIVAPPLVMTFTVAVWVIAYCIVCPPQAWAIEAAQVAPADPHSRLAWSLLTIVVGFPTFIFVLCCLLSRPHRDERTTMASPRLRGGG